MGVGVLELSSVQKGVYRRELILNKVPFISKRLGVGAIGRSLTHVLYYASENCGGLVIVC